MTTARTITTAGTSGWHLIEPCRLRTRGGELLLEAERASPAVRLVTLENLLPSLYELEACGVNILVTPTADVQRCTISSLEGVHIAVTSKGMAVAGALTDRLSHSIADPTHAKARTSAFIVRGQKPLTRCVRSRSLRTRSNGSHVAVEQQEKAAKVVAALLMSWALLEALLRSELHWLSSAANAWLQQNTSVTPCVRWFANAATNVVFNEIDRHVLQGHAEITAFIWNRANNVRELETRIAKVLMLGFEDCGTLFSEIGLIDFFCEMLECDFIQSDLEAKHVDLVSLYADDLKDVQATDPSSIAGSTAMYATPCNSLGGYAAHCTAPHVLDLEDVLQMAQRPS
jgi:hypothetical protein